MVLGRDSVISRTDMDKLFSAAAGLGASGLLHFLEESGIPYLGLKGKTFLEI